MKHIYVSPHSDDVALSCGGRILSNPSRGSDTLVLNVFTSEAPEGREEPGGAHRALFDSVNPERTSEDESAWDYAGVERHYLNLPESLLRNRFPFRIGPRADESEMASALLGALRPYGDKYPGAEFYFPAGFGSHVDHLICRDVAFRMLDQGLLGKIILYEDIPYSWLKFVRDQCYRDLLQSVELGRQSRPLAFRQDGESLSGYFRQKAVPFPRGKMLFLAVYMSMLAGNARRKSPAPRNYDGTVRTFALNDQCQADKKRLILHYPSQIPLLFGGRTDQVLERHHASFAIEVTMDISKKPILA